MSLESSISLEIEPDRLEPEIFMTVRSFADYIEASFAPGPGRVAG